MANKFDYGIYRGSGHEFDITDKDNNSRLLYNQFLNKTLGAFKWEGLEIPYIELEKILQNKGQAFITTVNEKLVAFEFMVYGDVKDVYGNYQKINVIRKDINTNQVYDISDGVIMQNDLVGIGLQGMFSKYASMIANLDVTLNMMTFHKRLPKIFIADDDTTKQSIDKFLKGIDEGKTSSIVTNSLFNESLDLKSEPNTQSSIRDVMDYQQYLYGKVLNEVGLNEPIQLKKDRLVSDEVLNSTEHKSLIYNMLYCRQSAVEKINEKFGSKISVSLSEARSNIQQDEDKEEVNEPNE